MEEVFVFGSNEQGFHGAGSAGCATRGVSDNTWRTDKDFLKAMKAPEGSSDKKGKLAEFWSGKRVSRGSRGKQLCHMYNQKAWIKKVCAPWRYRKSDLRTFYFCKES